jgi:hypothetical protein
LEYLSMMPSIVTNIQAYEKLAGNKVCYEMWEFVEFCSSDPAGSLLVIK